MRVSVKAKSVLASFLHLAGVNLWKLQQYSRDKIAVLMYHRIIPIREISRATQAGMVVEPFTLDLHIRYLQNYFEIVPLSNLLSFRYGDRRSLRRKPSCVLTFDDGWYDFYKYAYPILKMHNVPATVFLPTDFIGTNRWFWTDRVGFLFDRMAQFMPAKKFSSFFRDPLLRDLMCVSGTHEARLEKMIGFLKTYKIEKIEQILSEVSIELGEDPTPKNRAFLSWDEVREMSDSGLVSFGSHTAAHLLMTTVTEGQAEDELKKSMDALIAHNITDNKFISFSYPNGNFSDRLSEMVREAGYHLAVTTQYGWCSYGANPFTIPRIAVHQDMASTEAMFESRIVNYL